MLTVCSIPTVPGHNQTSPLRIRTNRAILSTDPGYMIGGFEIILQYSCLARLSKFTNSADSWGWEKSEFVEVLEQIDPQTIGFTLNKGIMWYDGTTA